MNNKNRTEFIEFLEEREYNEPEYFTIFLRHHIVPKSYFLNPRSLPKFYKVRPDDNCLISGARLVGRYGDPSYLSTERGFREAANIIFTQVDKNSPEIGVGIDDFIYNDNEIVLISMITQNMIMLNSHLILGIKDDFTVIPPILRLLSDKGLRHTSLGVPNEHDEESVKYQRKLDIANADNVPFKPTPKEFPRATNISLLSTSERYFTIDKDKIMMHDVVNQISISKAGSHGVDRGDRIITQSRGDVRKL